MHIRRKYWFFVTYIIFPCLLLSGVLLMVFLLPADSGEKVSLGVSILIAISVFLLLVASNLPNTSDAVPLIGTQVYTDDGFTAPTGELNSTELTCNKLTHFSGVAMQVA